MDLYIECPVCEQQFSTPAGPPEQEIACPDCSRTFPLSAAVEVDPPDENLSEHPDNSSRLEVPSAYEGRTQASADPIPIAKTVSGKDSVAQKPILALQRKRRNRRRLLTTLISSTILAAIIGVLGGLLVKQLKDNPISSDGTAGTVLADQTINPVNEIDVANSEINSNVKESSDEPEPPADTVEPQIFLKDIPPQEFEYLSRKSAKSRWNAVQPHLVSLKVFDGLGTHEAVGTIVDSRGWILTSYSAVKGASKIQVRASVKSIDDLADSKPLTDLVRGYIAEDKENDLVLLSINRRFIVAFSIVQPATSNDVVESKHLLQCAPPSRINPYGGTETRIVQRAGYDELEPVVQSMARRNGLQGNEVWLVAEGSTPPLPGTPMFKIDGDLEAICVFTVVGRNYYLPVERVQRLIIDADDNVKPLRELGLSAGDTGPVAVSTSNEMYEPSVRLNRLAESCKVFNWIPQTDEDYRYLQEFAEAYMVIEKYASDKANSTLPEEQKIIKLKNQLEVLIRKRAASFTVEDELLLAQMNKRFAGRNLQEVSRFVPFYGEVHYVDIVNAQFILKLFGTELYAKAPFIPSDNPMRMQTRWMFFGQTPSASRRVNYRISKSELVTVESLDEVLNFGEQ